ncbi:MAG: hypothetical protein AAFN77_12105 [Planctomycetota bacterium]
MSEADSSQNNSKRISSDDLNEWKVYLKGQYDAVSDGRGGRDWDFDMQDQLELDQPSLERFSKLKRSLEFLKQELVPVWQVADQDALTHQRTRLRTAAAAIWLGIAAIVLAIIQLMLGELSPKLVKLFTFFEVVAVIGAAWAVLQGTMRGTHHHWLRSRQLAERLRNLKFASLGRASLWQDEAKWQEQVKADIESLNKITLHDAESWAVEEDNAVPPKTRLTNVEFDADELAAFVSYYRYKRLAYQQNYFRRQSKKAHAGAWSVRLKIALVAFCLSMVFVFAHGAMSFYDWASSSPTPAVNHDEADLDGAKVDQPDGSATNASGDQDASSEKNGAGEQGSKAEAKPTTSDDDDHAADSHVAKGHGGHSSWIHQTEIVLVGLAALIPVIAFGFRAWMAAFEHPRSRNLFRAKANALERPTQLIEEQQDDLPATLQHISNSEYFFLGEHREWCRLQLESEWYV